MKSPNCKILQVYRTKIQTKKFYGKISRFYSFFGFFEKKYKSIALQKLNIKKGEVVVGINL